VELAIDEISVKLSITDTGKGVAPDFVRHSIFDVFSQEDPATEGAGLGLSIAKQTVSTLGGNILIDTDQAWGSSFNVTLPLSSVLSEMSHEMPGPQSNFLGSSLINLPQLTMTLFLPRRWDRDNIRGRRCTEMILESLTRDLRRWFQIDVALWETPSRHPRLFVVLSEDLDHAIHTCGHALDQTKLIVLCPKYEAAPSVHRTPSLDTAVIVGPVTVSKLQDALVCLFPGTVTHSGIGPSLDQMSDIVEYHVISTRSREGSPAKPADTVNNRLLSQSLSNMKLQEEKEEHGVWELIPATALPDTRSPELLESATRDALEMRQTINNDTSPQSTAARDPSLLVPLVNMKEPKLVLVDDNTINLKVLGMFARKCSRLASKSVNGGQEALDAYNEALTSDSDTSQPYDIMFLDLSMPEVSGFEVAAKIRETEASLKCTSHLYICALTGLASAKDRNRAYASGVDDYLVKPAGLKDIQAVINRWRDVCSNRQQQMC
jgi:CheY-like chemotaxis protein